MACFWNFLDQNQGGVIHFQLVDYRGIRQQALIPVEARVQQGVIVLAVILLVHLPDRGEGIFVFGVEVVEVLGHLREDFAAFRNVLVDVFPGVDIGSFPIVELIFPESAFNPADELVVVNVLIRICLLYTSPSPRD